MEEDVLGLEVVVDDFVWHFVEVADGVDDLPDYHLGLSLGYSLVLLEVVGKVRPLAVLQNSAERVLVKLNGIKQLHNIGVSQNLVHIVLPHSVFDVVLLRIVIPVGVELMNLAGHLPKLLYIKSFIHFAEPPFAK